MPTCPLRGWMTVNTMGGNCVEEGEIPTYQHLIRHIFPSVVGTVDDGNTAGYQF